MVTEVEPFIEETQWIDRFGERMILQTPDLMMLEPAKKDNGFTYLMQFLDGNRMNLTLLPLNHISNLPDDRRSVLLIDKAQHFWRFPPSTKVEPPSEKAFSDCCNEFWWVTPYIAKGLARDEILYTNIIESLMLRDISNYLVKLGEPLNEQ